MSIKNFYRDKGPIFSFEFFLPKNEQDLNAFTQALANVKKLKPTFVTLTYGAGGSARDRTIEMAGRLRNEFGFITMMHLTCIAHTHSEIERIVGQVASLGIDSIMALRGDVPKEGPLIPFEKREYQYAVDLVKHLKKLGVYTVGVAGYPEGHPEAPSKEKDLQHLKAKVQAGADFVTTQLFFNNQDYFDFCQRARAIGIQVPIVPGIMPITNFTQIKRFTSMCGTRIPEELTAELEPIQNDPEAVTAIGIKYALRQCQELLSQGAPGIHFYTLNKSQATQAILTQLRHNQL